MVIQVITPPTVEPVTLAEIKTAMGLSSGSYASEVTVTSSVAPGSHAVGTHTGTSADVLGKVPLIVWDWAALCSHSMVA